MAVYKEDLVNIELTNGTIHRSFMNKSIGSGDIDANRFGVRVLRDGEEVNLTGVSCFGYFRNAEGTNIALTNYGTVSGNTAYVTLPQACYAVEGRFTLSIKLIGGGVTGTMRIVDGMVDNTNTGSPVAPTADIPSYTEILAVYDQMVEAVEDYSETVAEQNEKIEAVETAIDTQKHSIMFGNGMYVLNNSATFEQGNFTSEGDSESTTWIRTPKANKIQNDFVIYNPNRLQFAVASFYGNQFVGYLAVGTDVVEGVIYRDQFAVVKRETGYEYRLRVSNYLASGNLTPEQNTLLIFSKYEDKTGVVRTVSPAVGNGAILDTGSIVSGANYRYTDVIKLNAGETIHFEYAGPSNLVALSEWTPSADGSSPVFSFESALITGDGFYHVAEYTAEDDLFVRISTMIYPVNGKPYTNADELLSSMFIFRAETYYDKASPLYGKTITLMGDSLSYGSNCGNGAVWLQRLALKHNMTAYNMGINGNAVTKGYGTGTAMCERYTSIEESDYIVVEGGANDKGGGAPIGTFWSDPTNFVMNTDKTTFMGALNTIISGLHDLYPKAKLLFLTDYNRYPSKLHAYPDAMKEVCMMRSVPCFDDFASSGIAVCEDGLKEWQDEGLWLGGSANYHFTPEAYRDVLLPKYENLLKNI